jgi:hypothetical protein
LFSSSKYSLSLWNKNVKCHIHKSQPSDPLLREFNPDNAISLRTNLNIIFAFMHNYPSGLLRGHVKWVPCHHSMACPQAADGGCGLQIWRVAANILNKQLQTADRGGPPAWGLGRGLTTSHRKTSDLL